MYGVCSLFFGVDFLDSPAFVFADSPSIVYISSSVETLVNTSVTLTCIGSGNPAPRVRWYKQGVNIARGIENGRGLTLDISSVQTTDAGVYRCTAKNEVGEDQARTRISVLGKTDHHFY